MRNRGVELTVRVPLFDRHSGKRFGDHADFVQVTFMYFSLQAVEAALSWVASCYNEGVPWNQRVYVRRRGIFRALFEH